MAEKGKLWDPWKMFDTSEQELRAIRERAKVREALKAEWSKKLTNPLKATSSAGGHIFDPAVMRFMGLKNTQAEYFKGTFRTASLAAIVYLLPVAFVTWHAIKNKDEKERMIRNGEIMYKDRQDKFFS